MTTEITFWEQACITTIKILVLTNFIGVAVLVFCLLNVLEPKK